MNVLELLDSLSVFMFFMFFLYFFCTFDLKELYISILFISSDTVPVYVHEEFP